MKNGVGEWFSPIWELNLLRPAVGILRGGLLLVFLGGAVGIVAEVVRSNFEEWAVVGGLLTMVAWTIVFLTAMALPDFLSLLLTIEKKFRDLKMGDFGPSKSRQGGESLDLDRLRERFQALIRAFGDTVVTPPFVPPHSGDETLLVCRGNRGEYVLREGCAPFTVIGPVGKKIGTVSETAFDLIAGPAGTGPDVDGVTPLVALEEMDFGSTQEFGTAGLDFDTADVPIREIGNDGKAGLGFPSQGRGGPVFDDPEDITPKEDGAVTWEGAVGEIVSSERPEVDPLNSELIVPGPPPLPGRMSPAVGEGIETVFTCTLGGGGASIALAVLVEYTVLRRAIKGHAGFVWNSVLKSGRLDITAKSAGGGDHGLEMLASVFEAETGRVVDFARGLLPLIVEVARFDGSRVGYVRRAKGSVFVPGWLGGAMPPIHGDLVDDATGKPLIGRREIRRFDRVFAGRAGREVVVFGLRLNL